MARPRATTQTKPKTKAVSSKKSGAAKESTHPSWVDMIKECILAHPEDARTGVSRPQIKKFVETKYRLEFNAAQVSQLSRAISRGAESDVFVLPKGPSGRVKLTPKVKAAAAKEDKPVPKAAPAKPKTAVAPKKAPAKKPSTKPTAKSTTAKASSSKAKTAVKPKPAAKTPATKKTSQAKKTSGARAKTTTTKKSTSPSKRGSSKKAVTGASAPAKAKAAKATTTKKTPAKKPAAKGSSTKSAGTKRTANK